MLDEALIFDPVAGDVVVRRGLDGWLRCNVPWRHVHHSPDGFNIGYGGSGPADFALNVVAWFLGPPRDPGPEPDTEAAGADEATWKAWEAWSEVDEGRVKLWDGSYVRADVWSLHQPFKWHFVAPLPREGGTIPGEAVRAWLRERHAVPVR